MSQLVFPENFTILHQGEEFLRGKSIDAIRNSEIDLRHTAVVESSMNFINHWAKQKLDDEDTKTIQQIGIRIFNGSAAALKLLLSGYYQNSALQQRDLLECIFLIDYFTIDRSKIALWRQSDDKERQKHFRPVLIRTALDDRDGFTERKREQAYDLLNKLAAHPTYFGFRMITPTGLDPHCGPFFDNSQMSAVLAELAKHMVQASTIFTRFFKPRTFEEYELGFSRMDLEGLWFETFYGRKYDPQPVAKLRSELAILKNKK